MTMSSTVKMKALFLLRFDVSDRQLSRHNYALLFLYLFELEIFVRSKRIGGGVMVQRSVCI